MTHTLSPFYDVMRNILTSGEAWVLATIVETQGSTYRKAGAKMLISQQGECRGLLSGGCLESDLRERAGPVFADGIARTVFYDLRAPEDLVWGLGLGCNGAVNILLQRLAPENHFHPLGALADAMEHDGGVLATVYASAHSAYSPGLSVFLPRNGSEISATGCPDALAEAARGAWTGASPACASHAIEGREVAVFYEPVRPLPRLLVIGAGVDARPLVEYAASLGWRVTVADYRPAHIRPERFRSAERLLESPPQALAADLRLERFAAAVLMTHHFENDSRYLKIIAGSPIPYIGLLGPALRKRRLLETLGDSAASVVARAFGPVGLDIGAATPEEIALSMMAGILAAYNGRTGGPLPQSEAPYHD